MLPNWLYGKSKSKLAELLGGGGTPSDYNQVKAQVTQNTEDITLLNSAVDAKVGWNNLSEVGAVNFLNHTATNLVENGITFTVNADRSITANGTATGEEWVRIAQNVAVSESVRASGCPKGGTPSTYFMTFSQGDNSNRDYGDGVIVPSGTISSVYLVIKANATVNNLVFKPMIAPSSYSGPYVPYAKTNKELTDDVAIKSSEITVNTTNVNSESVSRNYVNKSAGIKVLVLQARPKTDLVVGTTYELGTVPSDYLPSLSTGFIKEDVVNSTGSTALIEISSGKLKLTPRVNNLSTAYTFTISVIYV